MDSVSVVIPLYNKAPHIARALDSVLAQTSPPEEIVVIDDGSTDGGGEIVKSFNNPRIRLEIQENQGVSAARNRGIEIAQGELIAFLDADDEWKPCYLSTIRKMRKLYPDAGAYATAYEIIKPDGSHFRHAFKVLPQGMKSALIENIFKSGMPQPMWTSAVVIPKRILEENGGFKVGEVKHQDLDLWIRIGLKYSIAWHGDYLAFYHQDATNRVYRVTKFKQEPAFCRTVREALKSNTVPAEKLKDLWEYAVFWQLEVASDLIQSNQMKLARKILSEAKGTKHYNPYGIIYFILSYFPSYTFIILKQLKLLLNKIRADVKKCRLPSTPCQL